MTANRPLSCLHIVGAMDRGGIEAFLLKLFRATDRGRVRFQLVVHRPGAWDDKVERAGFPLHRCSPPGQPWRYAGDLAQVLLRHGPFDIVHSHVQPVGLPLLVARCCGVPLRVAHGHTAQPELSELSPPLLRLLGPVAGLLRRFANARVACSTLAGRVRFGASWGLPNDAVVFCAVDFDGFRRGAGAEATRRRLGLPEKGRVIGHVGRFAWEKNHGFLLEVFAEVARCEPTAHLLLVGDGPLRSAIDGRITRLELSDRVTLLGYRDDVPDLLCHAVDLFCLPSLHEGLPLALVEAQAAGLPCVVADGVTEEATVVPALVHRLPLAKGARGWAHRLLEILDAARPVDARSALARARASAFHSDNAVAALVSFYERAAREVGVGS